MAPVLHLCTQQNGTPPSPAASLFIVRVSDGASYISCDAHGGESCDLTPTLFMTRHTISVHDKAAAALQMPDTLQHAWGMQEILFDVSQAGIQWDFSHIKSAEAEMLLRPARLYSYASTHEEELLSKYCVRPRWVCYPADNEVVCGCGWKTPWGNVLALSQHEREKEGWLQWVLHHQSPFMW